MNKLMILLGLLAVNMCQGQHIQLNIQAKARLQTIKQGEEQSFEIHLQKDQLYNISVDQQGIDVVVYLKGKNQKLIEEKDSPTGKNGIEKISYFPDTAGTYFITVKPLAEKENAALGNYTIRVSAVTAQLVKYKLSQLQQDLEILKNAYVECKVGLWYNTYNQFDSVYRLQKSKLHDGLTALEFYKIVAPFTAYTKEGHSAIAISDETNDYLKQNGAYFPFFVKIIDRKIYALNDVSDLHAKGWMITKINGIGTDSILNVLTQIEPSDGYNFTGKYRWIEASFPKYYLRFFGAYKTFVVECVDPSSGQKITRSVPALNFKAYAKWYTDFRKANPQYFFSEPATISIDSQKHYAVLTINDFGSRQYKGRKEGFAKYIDSIFTKLNEKQVTNLVIDIRKNEGGTQGMEDIVLSHLVTKEYLKYKYVEIPAFEYSFLDYTDYKNEAAVLKEELTDDFYQTADGRYLNKKGHYEGLAPSPIHFSGNVYILISGLTFSGGSEFASLVKNHANAIFIGDETSGGYYGNTSGSFLKFQLPNTGLTGRIPLCKFASETPKDSISFGRGLTPDYPLQQTIQDVINNNDVVFKFALQLMQEGRAVK